MRRVLQIEPAALVRVGGCRANGVVDAIERAGTQSQEYGRIHFISGKQVACLAPDIVRGHQPVGPKLSLQAQVPLIHDGRLRVVGMGGNEAKGGKHDILVDHRRKGISAGVGCPWIRELHVLQGESIAKRRVLSEPGQCDDHLAVYETPVPRPHRHAPVPFWIPRQSDTRKKLVPPVTFNLLAAFISCVAGIDHSDRAFDKHGAAHILIEQILLEMAKPAVFTRPRKVRFPAQAVVQRQPRGYFPRVLRVGSKYVLAVVIRG